MTSLKKNQRRCPPTNHEASYPRPKSPCVSDGASPPTSPKVPSPRIQVVCLTPAFRTARDPQAIRRPRVEQACPVTAFSYFTPLVPEHLPANCSGQDLGGYAGIGLASLAGMARGLREFEDRYVYVFAVPLSLPTRYLGFSAGLFDRENRPFVSCLWPARTLS